MCHPAPTVSVVVPLYNKAGTVLAAVGSVLAQTHRDFELLVIDDGSTDGGPDLLSAFTDPRLRLIVQPNAGVSAARNRGIAESKGELVAFLDADDLWEPAFLAAIVDLRQAFPQAGLYATGVGRCWCDGRPDLLTSAAAPPGSSGVLIADYYEALREGDPVSASSVCVPRAVLLEHGGFAEGEAMGEDLDLWVRIALRYPLACDPRILAFYFTPPAREGRIAPLLTPQLPLPARSLLGLSSQTPASAARTARFIDWQLAKQADTLLWRRDRAGLLSFLAAAPFQAVAARRRAALLAAAARLLPLSVVCFLRWKPARLFARFHAPSAPPLLCLHAAPCRHPASCRPAPAANDDSEGLRLRQF